jgi:hypothetical protein
MVFFFRKLFFPQSKAAAGNRRVGKQKKRLQSCSLIAFPSLHGKYIAANSQQLANLLGAKHQSCQKRTVRKNVIKLAQ